MTSESSSISTSIGSSLEASHDAGNILAHGGLGVLVEYVERAALLSETLPTGKQRTQPIVWRPRSLAEAAARRRSRMFKDLHNRTEEGSSLAGACS